MPNSFLRRDAGLRRIPLACLFALALLLLALITLPPSSRATREQDQASLTKAKRTRPAFVPGEVLIRYKNEAVAKRQSRSATLESSLGRTMTIQIERFEGSEIVEGLRIARVPAADTMTAIKALRKQPDVLYAEPNYILHRDNTPNDPNFSSLYGLTKIGAPQAWDTTTGSASIVVGVVDEGIDINHPDLAANVWVNPGETPGNGADDDSNGLVDDVNGWDFEQNNNSVFDNTGMYKVPCDPRPPPVGNDCDQTEAHGTHVSGIVGAVGNNGTGVVGVNWNVRLMSLKFLGAQAGDTADAIRALGYAKQMRDRWIGSIGSSGANVRVLNNSYGGGGFTQSFLDSINALNQSGILFVAAAGNFPDDPEANNDLVPHYPASYNAPNVIAVASTNQSDNLSSFSHFGVSSVHLGAPGSGILSTTPSSTYDGLSGTSMATPHVAGAAALICAQNPNLTPQQVKALLILNGDVLPALQGKTLTGRRLNVAKSLQALAEIDVTAPGTVSNFRVNSPNGRSITLAWTASGDDGATGQASLYQLSFTDATTGAVIPLPNAIPAASDTPQTLDVKFPYRHTSGTISLRVFDNVGNEGIPATVNVSVPIAEGDPYATTLSIPVGLSTGGTALGLIADDRYRENHSLPFAFPFFGQNFNTVTISTNGNLYFSAPPKRSDPIENADDVPSSTADLSQFKMISGLWDDLRTDRRAGDDVYVVTPDASRVIFRWQAVTFGDGTAETEFPVNFEIELRTDGTILTRYGNGQSAPTNTGLFPVVGIGGGEPEAYTIETHTSELVFTNLTNAVQVIFIPRATINPLENPYFFVSQHYRDFLGREPESGGLAYWSNELTLCGTSASCIKQRRVGVSAAFFIELEFQRTGSFVYRLYKGGLARRPTYQEFNTDRAQIVEGPNLEADKQALALAFVQRNEFVQKFAGQTDASSFVTELTRSIQQASNVDLSTQRDTLIAKYNTGANMNQSRALALREAIDSTAFVDGEYNKAFVTMQYFGYLRRDPDPGGYNHWLGIVNDPSVSNYRSMVCAFITSREYQELFSPLVPRNDSECSDIF